MSYYDTRSTKRFRGGNMETDENDMESNEETMVPKKMDGNTIFIGKKGTMGYVLAVVTQFNNGTPEVVVKARGKLISKAVDVVEIFKNRFMPSVNLKKINISTEELTSEDGSKSKVSAIEIIIAK